MPPIFPGKVAPACESHIAGIGPWAGTRFLLAVAECGNVLDWLAGLLYRGRVDRMLKEALDCRVDPHTCPALRMNNSGRFDLTDVDLSCDRARIARAALEFYAGQFGELLGGISNVLGKPRRIIAGGGLSRSRAWISLLERRHGVKLETCSTEHPTLLGVARIIRASRSDDG